MGKLSDARAGATHALQPVAIDVVHHDRISHAQYQNGLPIIRDLSIRNDGSETLRDIEVRVYAEPSVGETASALLEELQPGQRHAFDGLDLLASPGLLGRQEERSRAELRVEVRAAGEIVASHKRSVELLAHNQWPGSDCPPELLCAFVQPNHPALSPFLRESADLLRQWTGDPSLAGYQTRDPERVRQTAAAVYGALQQRDVTYVNPPASFESNGQKVRTPEQLSSASMGTCLDLAVHAAACLEQTGLHPLLFVVEGHAFAGVWLVEDVFPEPTLEDPLRVLKRVELGEIAVFDPTLATTRPGVPFDKACRVARDHLEDTRRFLCAIDVGKTRAMGIQPLASGAGAHASLPNQGPGTPERAVAPTPDAAIEIGRRAAAASSLPRREKEPVEKRLERWQSKLLDLSLRNRLLNYRPGKRSVPLLVHDIGALEDALAGGDAFTLHPKPEALSRVGEEALVGVLPSDVEEQLAPIVDGEFRSKRLRSVLTPKELDKRLTEIYRAARVSREEGGVHILYLAIGLLEWFESTSSQKKRLAPLLLLPLDLHRERVGAAMRIELGEDDAMLNVTLMRKLQQDFQIDVGLDELPTDASGLDVELILRQFREATRDQDRWRVLDQAHLGLFTFTKFVMWNDLANRQEDLLVNPLVRNILDGTPLPEEVVAGFPEPSELDDRYHPRDVFCPLDADSTQLAAVQAAAEGRSFVLEGPPGTGKSQTITNLVAQCLANGKKVLFVSEKMAALNVVHKRLAAIGLGPFCLELHSNKARKREVVHQFAEALELAGRHEPTGWEERASALAARRAALNGYAEAVGRPRSFGESVFQVTSRVIGLREVPRVDLELDGAPASIDEQRREEMWDAARQLERAAVAASPVPRHPWRGAETVEWTPSLERTVSRELEGCADALADLREAAADLGGQVSLGDLAEWNLDALEALADTSTVLLASPEPPESLLSARSWQQTRANLEQTLGHGRRRRQAWETLEPHWREDLLGMDLHLDDLQARFRRWATAFFLIAFFMLFTARRKLKPLSRTGRLPKNPEIAGHLERAREAAEEKAAMERGAEEARQLLGPVWRGADTDWDRAAGVVEWTTRFREANGRLAASAPEGTALAERLRDTACGDAAQIAPGAPIGRRLVAYRDAFGAVRERLAALSGVVGLGPAAWPASDGPAWIEDVAERLDVWRSEVKALRPWSHYLRSRAKACESGLEGLVRAVEGGEVAPSDIDRVFERALHEWWLEATIAGDDVLRTFQREEHERRIEQFREMDRSVLEVAQDEARARLAAGIPSPRGPRSQNSEMGLLLRELQKKRSHMPVRKLFHKIPSLVGQLKPCLLMSPLSVAQYLDPALPPFDLVVFDEASQMPPWEAIGAIARSKQVVVVGDPKQLPPTNFFQKMESEDGAFDEDDFDELESILDESLASGLPHRHLGWHYRSRHEGLIAFSNRHYYGDRLVTFPCAEAEVPQLGVSWRHVPDGHYDRGGKRHNEAEARAVVAEIVRRLRDPEESRRSIGVVTFSTAQQQLIEDMLDRARQERPELEPFFAESCEERVFVKNLENVQGDERDIILFSVCYGPDQHGRVSMNFGPLNRDGGERRLNVAITRAREQVVLFSTLVADQIDLRRTSAIGVKHLLHYLRYAEEGPASLDASTAAMGRLESPFEEDVYRALTARGWDLDAQVGCSDYRIDLAARDADAPGRYILGIECDGATYHSSRFARERDRLRQQVLEGLGWRLHRIWSTDWWHDPDSEIVRVEQALEEATRAQSALAAPKPTTPEPPLRSARPPASRQATDPARVAEVVARYAEAPDPTEDPLKLPGAQPYQVAVIPPVDSDRSDFHARQEDGRIRSHLRRVLEVEAPISVGLLARRLTDAWDISKTKKVQRRVTSLLGDTPGLVVDGDFVSLATTSDDFDGGFRVPTSDEGRRDPQDLPIQEVANAASTLLAHGAGMTEDDLVRDLARIFGFGRTGKRVRDAMLAGIEHLVDDNRARRSGERIEPA